MKEEREKEERKKERKRERKKERRKRERKKEERKRKCFELNLGNEKHCQPQKEEEEEKTFGRFLFRFKSMKQVLEHARFCLGL